MALYINGKREGGGNSEPLVFLADGSSFSMTVQHDLGRKVMVTYYNSDNEEVEIAVCYVDDDTVEVSSVQFLNGYILVA